MRCRRRRRSGSGGPAPCRCPWWCCWPRRCRWRRPRLRHCPCRGSRGRRCRHRRSPWCSNSMRAGQRGTGGGRTAGAAAQIGTLAGAAPGDAVAVQAAGHGIVQRQAGTARARTPGVAGRGTAAAGAARRGLADMQGARRAAGDRIGQAAAGPQAARRAVIGPPPGAADLDDGGIGRARAAGGRDGAGGGPAGPAGWRRCQSPGRPRRPAPWRWPGTCRCCLAPPPWRWRRSPRPRHRRCPNCHRRHRHPRRSRSHRPARRCWCPWWTSSCASGCRDGRAPAGRDRPSDVGPRRARDRRDIAREPLVAPLVRDLALYGAPEELSLSQLAATRPLLVAFDPRWDKRFARHLVPQGAFDVISSSRAALRAHEGASRDRRDGDRRRCARAPRSPTRRAICCRRENPPPPPRRA